MCDYAYKVGESNCRYKSECKILIYGLHTKCIDITLTFRQVNAKVPIYLITPPGIQLGNYNNISVLKLIKNLYGFCDVERTWCEYFFDELSEMELSQTENRSMCLYKRWCYISDIYIDNCKIPSNDFLKRW